MSTRLPGTWVLAVGLIVTACGAGSSGEVGQTTASSVAPTSSTQPPSTSTSSMAPTSSGQPPSTSTSSPGFVSTGELDVIVLPDGSGEYPHDLVVRCPSGPELPISALAAVALISPDDPDGMLAAIEPFLGSGEGQFWPQEGWQLLHRTTQEAILVTPFEGNLSYMFLERKGDEWVWSGSSISGNPCELQYTIPEGLNTVDWRLDPSVPEPGPNTTELVVLLSESECVSGQEIGDRLVGPQVVMTDTDVRIAFAAESPPGDVHTCQGNPETAYTVELPRPLGDREIIEAMSIGLSLEDYLH